MVPRGRLCGGISKMVGGPPYSGLCVSEARVKAEQATMPPHRAAKEDPRGQDGNSR